MTVYVVTDDSETGHELVVAVIQAKDIDEAKAHFIENSIADEDDFEYGPLGITETIFWIA